MLSDLLVPSKSKSPVAPFSKGGEAKAALVSFPPTTNNQQPTATSNQQQPATLRKKLAISNQVVIPAAFNSRMAGQAGTQLRPPWEVGSLCTRVQSDRLKASSHRPGFHPGRCNRINRRGLNAQVGVLPQAGRCVGRRCPPVRPASGTSRCPPISSLPRKYRLRPWGRRRESAGWLRPSAR